MARLTLNSFLSLPHFIIMALALASASLAGFAQPAYEPGDFRSRYDGSWTSPEIWEQYNGSTWEMATPNENSIVYIRDTIQVESARSIKSIFILAEGYLQLNGDLSISGRAEVNDGGWFDFDNFNLIGSGLFRLNKGGSLRITSPDGINKQGDKGNIRVTGTRGDNNTQITLLYAGSQSQYTGDYLSSGSTNKIIIIDNPDTVRLTSSIGISNPGRVEIQQGVLITTNDGFISGSGNLKMYGGKFLTSVTEGLASIPRLDGTYTMIGGTLELNGNQQQTLKNKEYFNLTFSGGNIVKTTGAITRIGGTVTISGETTVDVERNSFGRDSTNFVMESGKFRSSHLSSSVPSMNGDYNITGGTVELYGTNASQKQTLRGGKSYHHVEINALAANVGAGNASHGGTIGISGVFTINAPAAYQTLATSIIEGPGTFEVKPGATFNYGNVNGITTAACGQGTACGNIRTVSRVFSTEANYGLSGGSASMVTGNGLPGIVKELRVLRVNDAILTNTIVIKDKVELSSTGNLITVNEVNAPRRVILDNQATIVEVSQAKVVGLVQAESFLGASPQNFGGLGVELSTAGGDAGITVVTRETGKARTGSGNEGIHRSFTILPENNENLQATMVFHYEGTELNGLNEDMLELYRSENGETDWTAEGGILNTTNRTITKTAIESFSTWTAGSSESALPVTFLSFSGKALTMGNLISWSTASELGNAGFEVQRSIDAKNFEALSFVGGKGTSTHINHYTYKDEAVQYPAYYRLKQVDFNGRSTFSTTIRIEKKNIQEAIVFYPNPFVDRISIRSDEKGFRDKIYNFQIFSSLGNCILQTTGRAEKIESLATSKLYLADKGIYLLIITTDLSISRSKIVKH